MEAKETTKQPIFVDQQKINMETVNCKSNLNLIQKIKDWYSRHELDLNFQELKKIAGLKESERYPFFWSKFISQKTSVINRKAMEKAVAEEVGQITAILQNANLNLLFGRYALESKDLDLKKMRFADSFYSKIRETYTYHPESEEEEEVRKKIQDLSQQLTDLKQFVEKKFGFKISIMQKMGAAKPDFFKEEIDKIEPDTSSILTLRRIQKGKATREWFNKQK